MAQHSLKLLLDENLSRRIVPLLQNHYPGSTQVALVGLERAIDHEVWEFARDTHYVIVTRDADFLELSLLLGQPPKVIRLRIGNSANAAVVAALLNHHEAITTALVTHDKPYLEIG